MKNSLHTAPEVDPRLLKLPAPVPGVVLNIPIELYPAYMKFRGLEPNGYNHPVLYVKRGAPNVGLTKTITY